jgi:hypothetical protein
MWWIVVVVIASAVVGFAMASLRRETASTGTLDERAGDYLAFAFALAAVVLVIFLSKLA